MLAVQILALMIVVGAQNLFNDKEFDDLDSDFFKSFFGSRQTTDIDFETDLFDSPSLKSTKPKVEPTTKNPIIASSTTTRASPITTAAVTAPKAPAEIVRVPANIPKAITPAPATKPPIPTPPIRPNVVAQVTAPATTPKPPISTPQITQNVVAQTAVPVVPPRTPASQVLTTPGQAQTIISTSLPATAQPTHRIRQLPTKTMVATARQALRDLIDRNKAADGSRPFNAGFLRLSFHDCVGPFGCDGCLNLANEANENLDRYLKPLNQLYDEKFEANFTKADFIALAGIVGVQYAAELGCKDGSCIPNIPFKWGRLDCSNASQFIHIFCPFHEDAMPFFKAQFGLNADEVVAIMGAHTIGRVNRKDGDSWDDTPDIFDNGYHKALIGFRDWKLADKLRTSKDLPKSWTHADNKGLMLGSDIYLISNISAIESCNPDPMRCPMMTTRPKVLEYAKDGKLFINDFAKAYEKILSKGRWTLQLPLEG